MLEAAVQDVRIAFRLLRKSPVFTLTAALSLAIGIGANTAIFSLVNGLLFSDRPGITAGKEVVDVGRTRRGAGFDTSSYPNYLDLKRGVPALRDLAAYRIEPIAMSLRDPGGRLAEPERIFVTSVSGNYFDVLGTRPAVGRLFAASDDESARKEPTIVLSYGVWDRQYQRDPAIVGRAVLINGIETRIVGVAPPGFRGPNFMAPDAWLPLGAFPVFNPRGDAMFTERRIVWLILVGRLQPGATVSQAQAQISTVARQLEAAHPESNRDMGWTVSPSTFVPAPFRGMVRGFLALLMTIVGLVLLIACINLAGVLLARGAGRRRELAVRLAVGAGRGRIVRQLVTETLAIFVVGCVGGVLLAVWLIGLLASLPEALPFPIAIDVSLSAPVVLFALAVTLVSGVLSGLVPALDAARTDLLGALKDDAGSFGLRRLRLRGALLVAQIALSCVLFLGAALFARSLQSAGHIDPGFDARGVDAVTLDLAMSGRRDADAARFAEQLVERVGRVPGITGVALTRMIPLQGGGMGLGGLSPAGGDPARDSIDADWNIVTADYFEVLRIPFRAGRTFTAVDREGAPAVAIVNETFAKRAWPNRSAVGQRLIRQTPDSRSELEVVGVVRDGKYRSLGEAPMAHIFVPHAQHPSGDMSLLVRRSSDASAVPAVRGVLRELAPDMPIVTAQPLSEAVAVGLMPQRVAAKLAGSLGFIGLLLAALGIYGVTAFSVAQRTREIGVRVALGAPRSTVLRMVVRQGMRLAVVGVAVGLAGGAALARLLSSLLYGLGANDPVTFGAVAVIFCAIAGLASYMPARAALKIDPLRALRVE
jgi:predicted permease